MIKRRCSQLFKCVRQTLGDQKILILIFRENRKVEIYIEAFVPQIVKKAAKLLISFFVKITACNFFMIRRLGPKIEY